MMKKLGSEQRASTWLRTDRSGERAVRDAFAAAAEMAPPKHGQAQRIRYSVAFERTDNLNAANINEQFPMRSGVMDPEGNVAVPTKMNREQWVERLRQVKGHYTPLTIDPEVFAGRVEARKICGFDAVVVQTEGPGAAARTLNDVRRDGFDHYYAIFQMSGSSAIIQRDTVLKLSVGNVAVVDSALPVTYICEGGQGGWLSLLLPRSKLLSRLGFEPKEPVQRSNAAAAERMLFHFVTSAAEDRASPRAEAWIQLAVYDLLGALYASTGQADEPLHTDKLFKRVCGIVEDRFTDPDIDAREIAAEAGISLRYMQKLFTVRGTTFGHFVASLRLDLAANIIRRRALIGSGQSLNSIAYSCGYRDYTHFSRAYRSRFGCAPGASSNSNFEKV